MAPKFSWDDFPEAQTGSQGGASGGKFNWDSFQSAPGHEDDSFDPKAAVQGFGNFAAAGYVPELTGLAGKLLPDPNADLDAKLKAQGFKINQPGFTGETTDESRALQHRLAHESPYSYYSGGAAGALASAPAFGAALKGLGIAKEVPAVAGAADASGMAKVGAYARNLGARMLQAGKEGAVIGAASNPNTEVGESGLNVGKRLINAGLGGASSAAIPVVADAVSGAARGAKAAAKWGTTKLLSSLGGVKPEVINEYAQFADRINAAPTVEKLKEISDEFVGKLASDVDAKKLSAEQAQAALQGFQSDLKKSYRVAGYDARDAVTSAQQTLKDASASKIERLSGDVYDTVNQLKSDVQAGSGKALDTLNKSGAKIQLDPVYSHIDDTVSKLSKAGTDESLAVAEKLKAYKERLVQQHGDFVSAPDAKSLIKGLDAITEYSPLAGSFDKAKNAAFKGVRSAIDGPLKEAVPEYRAQMEKVASDADLLNRVSSFGDQQRAAGLLGRLDAPNQMERRAALQELGQRYGMDFTRAASPEALPEYGALQKAQSAQEALRPDRVAEKVEQTVGSSRQKSALDAAQAEFEAAKERLAPFKSLAPDGAGQTQAQQKLTQLGKGANIELTDMFQRLGKLTDTDFVQAMKDRHVLAAFEKGAANGSRNTLMGALTGSLFGGEVGAAAGGAVGRAVDQWGPAITKKILDGALQVSRSPTMATISELNLPPAAKQQMILGLEAYLSKGRLGSKAEQGAVISVASEPNQPSPKGEALWMQRGLENLGIRDDGQRQRLLASPKVRGLLIQASDLKPGTKALQNVRKQIDQTLAGGVK